MTDKAITSDMTKDEMPESLRLGAKILFDMRAEDVEVLDLQGISSVADFYLVATCNSEAQMQAILNNLRRDFKKAKLPFLGVEYRQGVRWAVFDAADIMVHLFEANAREEYALGNLWRDGKRIELDPEQFLEEQTDIDQDHEFL